MSAVLRAAFASLMLEPTMISTPVQFTGEALTDWLPIAQWRRCQEFARPGIVFEIRNADELSLLAECSEQLPKAPWDWKSPPREFRAVVEGPPERSAPMPAPGG